jgi:hypothetical protein
LSIDAFLLCFFCSRHADINRMSLPAFHCPSNNV